VRIGVLSDIHANAGALAAALAACERERAEELVVMGDLLTYGCDVSETIELLLGLVSARPGTTFLVGNHDQLYFELQSGEPGYFDKLQPWIKESAQWTREALGARHLRDLFAWREERVVGDVLFAHANPFGGRDWTYLAKPPALAQAAAALAGRGLRAGVFGHTHRAMAECVDGVWIFNPGSVGQPRDDRGRSSAAVLDTERLAFTPLELDYDERAHCERVRQSTLTGTTKREILKYHLTGSPQRLPDLP
jgi:predicted phosphodiesterase